MPPIRGGWGGVRPPRTYKVDFFFRHNVKQLQTAKKKTFFISSLSTGYNETFVKKKEKKSTFYSFFCGLRGCMSPRKQNFFCSYHMEEAHKKSVSFIGGTTKVRVPLLLDLFLSLGNGLKWITKIDNKNSVIFIFQNIMFLDTYSGPTKQNFFYMRIPLIIHSGEVCAY